MNRLNPAVPYRTMTNIRFSTFLINLIVFLVLNRSFERVMFYVVVREEILAEMVFLRCPSTINSDSGLDLHTK